MDINFQVNSCVAPEIMADNIEANVALGVPIVGPKRLALPQGAAWMVPLAVVGGGPSLARYGHALKNWEGPMWAVNGAWTWCQDQGFTKATLFSVDPHGCLMDIIKGAEEKGHKVKKAILATVTERTVVAYLKEQGADIILFDMGEGQLSTGPTSATAALVLAPIMGHNAVNLFGCESSYPTKGGDHVYENGESDPAWFKIGCNGGEFLTKPEWFIQAQVLATALREHPQHFREHGGGLLHNLVQDAEFTVTAMSKAFAENLTVEGQGELPQILERP